MSIAVRMSLIIGLVKRSLPSTSLDGLHPLSCRIRQSAASGIILRQNEVILVVYHRVPG